MIFILTAKKFDGSIIILSSKMEKEQLREWRKTARFLCPQCDDLVHLKVGEIIIPHFAHKKNASCTASFSEGESKEHLEGKRQLYEFLRSIGKEVVLEPYFKSLAQRPDLLVTSDLGQVPIEFQCSTIPVKQIELRTRGYESASMRPVWLLRTPSKLMALPQGVGVFHFSRFERSFFTHQIPVGLVFLTYDPKFEQFHYFSNLFHVTGKQYIGTHRILPISKQIFPFARPKIPTEKELQQYVHSYLSMRKKILRTRILFNRRGINDSFLRGCYELRITPEQLPLWIGVPVKYMGSFHENACEWQLDFLFFMRKHRLKSSNLTEVEIHNFIQGYEGPSEKLLKACVCYRNFLLDVGIESLDDKLKLDEKELVNKITTILAKSNEN
ncbi:competence protein CoiA [Sporosarcina sp. G11-34]|uniref:competence protein CoiA n=1 Tax=Sporosarcina sp. G11-34 TaxID=2849605 RepID=UPI0022A8EDFB|nr:competence protein CoiA family protein [Sporosarcina sp. G11-34]MCZ2257222.1 hypothetical protein [Sporosarcina sp. G11-34]